MKFIIATKGRFKKLSKKMSFFLKLYNFLIIISFLSDVLDLLFQAMNSVRSNSLILKYKRFTPSGCKENPNSN